MSKSKTVNKTANKTVNKSLLVRILLRKDPNTKAKTVADAVDCTMQQAHVMLNTQRKILHIYKRKDGTFVAPPHRAAPPENNDLAPAGSLNNIVETHFPIEMVEPQLDPVNHPWHYKVGGIETIDFIEAKKLNYNLGNAVKYITRADHKGNRLQDLQKAQWYLNREIANAQA